MDELVPSIAELFHTFYFALFQQLITPVNGYSLMFEQALDLAEKDKACLMIFHCFTELMLEPLIKAGTALDF